MSPRILICVYVAIFFAPLLIVFLIDYSPRSVLDEIGSAAGMVAFAIVLAEFTLSGRFRTISRRAGMDVTMRVHQLIARTAVVLALVHPFLYRAEWNPPYPWDVTRDLTVTSDPGLLWSGIIAWLFLPTLVLLALSRGRSSYRYETWRWMHGLGAVAIGGLVLHHALVAGRYTNHPALEAFWWALFAGAVFSLIWVYLLVPLHQSRRPWRLAAVRSVAERIWDVEVEPVGHNGMDYEAGQFAWLNIGFSPFRHRENPFSISSAPASGKNLRFLIKELGDTTSHIGSVAPGTRAYVDGPHGALTVPEGHGGGIGLIAGGIGVAPLIGILRELSLTHDPRPRKLLYADRHPGQIAHGEEIARLAEAPETEISLVFEAPDSAWIGERGYIDQALLQRQFTSEAFDTWVFILCGPPPMLNAVEEALVDLGVSPERILSERFDYD